MKAKKKGETQKTEAAEPVTNEPERRAGDLEKKILDANSPVLIEDPDELLVKAEESKKKGKQVGGHKAGPTLTDKTRRLKNALLRALVRHRGVVSMACAETGIHRSTFYDWREADPNFAKAALEIEDVALDFAENRLFSAMSRKTADGVTATIFYLKTRGKKRGYIERNEITGPNGDPLGVSTASALAAALGKMTPEQRAARRREIQRLINEKRS